MGKSNNTEFVEHQHFSIDRGSIDDSTEGLNYVNYESHFDVKVETKEPNWSHIVNRTIEFVIRLASRIESAYATQGITLNNDSLRTRIAYGLGFWSNVCGKGALHATKGRGFTFMISDDAEFDEEGNAYVYKITIKRNALSSFIHVGKAVDGNSITIYRVAAITLDLYLEVAESTDYIPNWLTDHALHSLDKRYMTLASCHWEPDVAGSIGARAIRDAFSSFMNNVDASKRGAFSRNITLEEQIILMPKTPQLMNSRYVVREDEKQVEEKLPTESLVEGEEGSVGLVGRPSDAEVSKLLDRYEYCKRWNPDIRRPFEAKPKFVGQTYRSWYLNMKEMRNIIEALRRIGVEATIVDALNPTVDLKDFDSLGFNPVTIRISQKQFSEMWSNK